MDTTANGMRAAIKALKDTVAPALDPANPLANEQLRLACAYLALVADRLPSRAQKLRRELDAACALAEELLPASEGAMPVVREALRERISAARALASRATAPEDEITNATQRLQAAVGALVRCANDMHAAQRAAIERTVLRSSREWLDTRRAWFQPLGFDKEASALPPLDRILHER